MRKRVLAATRTVNLIPVFSTIELQPFAGEEMNLPQSDPQRAGFVAGERALAARVRALLDEMGEPDADPIEEEMVMSLGRAWTPTPKSSSRSGG